MVSPAWVATTARAIAATGWELVGLRGRRPERAARTSLAVAYLVAAPAVHAQEVSPLASVEALALDTATRHRPRPTRSWRASTTGWPAGAAPARGSRRSLRRATRSSCP
jgi:hypothetical protein